ncbi:hypothetical protein GYMLUDRAFT_86475, partial [Collybiopsis luxurians FD-317 M1]
MDSFSYASPYDPSQPSAAANQSSLAAQFLPPPVYNQNFHYDFLIPTATDDHRLLSAAIIGHDSDVGDSGVQFYRSRYAPEYYGPEHFARMSWSSLTDHDSLLAGVGSTTTMHSTSVLEPDLNLEHFTSYSPSVPRQDPIDDAAVKPWSASWSLMETHNSFESRPGVARTQNGDLFRPSSLDLQDIFESSFADGIMNYDCQGQYSPTESSSLTSWSDTDFSQSPSSTVTPTIEHSQSRVHPQFHVLQGDSAKPAQKAYRRVGSLAIVGASRKRRKGQPTRFRCTEPDCDVEFTAKHTFKDHCRRHAGDKPFGCELCGVISF